MTSSKAMDVDPKPRSESDGELPLVMDVDISSLGGDASGVDWADHYKFDVLNRCLNTG